MVNKMRKQKIEGLMVDDNNQDLLLRGWHLNADGYVVNGIQYKDENGKNRYKGIMMHRLVMERSINRPLIINEQVRHHNNNLVDNRLDNLYILDRRDRRGRRATKVDDSLLLDVIRLPLSSDDYYVTVIDKQDIELSSYSWHEKDGYAQTVLTNYYTEDGKRRPLMKKLHRMVMGSVLGRELEYREHVEHINRDRLDNRRINLRLKEKKIPLQKIKKEKKARATNG